MKKYILHVLSLCLFINQLIASDVLITRPDRFYSSGGLISEAVRIDLPKTHVVDSVLGALSPALLSTDSSLITNSSGYSLSLATRQAIERAQGAFGTVRLVQELWNNTLESFPQKCPITGCTPICVATANWNKQRPLTIDSQASCMEGCQLNAYYDPKEHKLVFPQFIDKGRKHYTSSSFDVAAHEAGHACLNAMVPSLLKTGRLDHKALHESFGDLTALFASLQLASAAQQKAWLAKPSMGTCIGGDLTGSCIRDPHDGKSISCEEHSLSKPLTRFMCDYLQHQWKYRAYGIFPSDILRQAQHDFLAAILLNQTSDNILIGIMNYFHKHKTPVHDSYLTLLTWQFTSCKIAA